MTPKRFPNVSLFFSILLTLNEILSSKHWSSCQMGKQKPCQPNSHNNAFTNPTRMWCSKTAPLKTQIKQWKKHFGDRTDFKYNRQRLDPKTSKPGSTPLTRGGENKRGIRCVSWPHLPPPSLPSTCFLAGDLFPFTVFTPCLVRWVFQQRRPVCQWGKRPWRRRAGYGPEPLRQISTPLQPAKGTMRTGKDYRSMFYHKPTCDSCWNSKYVCILYICLPVLVLEWLTDFPCS